MKICMHALQIYMFVMRSNIYVHWRRGLPK